MTYCDKINCGYWYKLEDEDFPSCHCEDWTAPCEETYDEDEDRG
jgi:hypothetical protein